MGRQRTATTLSFNTEKDKGKFLSVGENGWLEWADGAGSSAGVDEVARQQITALTEEIAKLPTGGGGAAIIDVAELPETDIREDVFYRVLTGAMYFNQALRQMDKCYIVETLPNTGEPAVTPDMSQITVYYAKDTGTASGYLSPELAGAFGYPAGWYPAEALVAATGNAYGGIVGSLDEMTAANTFYLLIQNVVKYHNNEGWNDLQGIGWTGDDAGAERFNTLLNVASGGFSHAEGYNTTASGGKSHAEGYDTTASGDSSHAEGRQTTASETGTHAEGSGTTASGINSHAEGSGTTASGINSHAEGSGTIAASYDQHVQGRYNQEDTSNKYAHIVGNGGYIGGNLSRSNAHTLDWDGNAWFAGGIELTSPNGTRYRFTVSDDGTLTAKVVAE